MVHPLAVKKELLRGMHMHKSQLYNATWKASLKKVHIVWLRLHDILEKQNVGLERSVAGSSRLGEGLIAQMLGKSFRWC